MASFQIDEQIGYWLILLSRVYRRRLQIMLAELDLFTGQDLLLICLWGQDGQTQSDLANKLGIQQATLTRMITRIEKTGLVVRKSDYEDARVSRVFLTNAGKKLRQAVEAIWSEIENQVFHGLTTEERLLLRRLLMQLHAETHSE